MKFLQWCALLLLLSFLGCGDGALDWEADDTLSPLPDIYAQGGDGVGGEGDSSDPNDDDSSAPEGGDTWGDVDEEPIDIPECISDLEYFESYIWGNILSIKCAGCHNKAGTAKESNMLFNDPALPESLEENFETFKAMALTKVGSKSIILLKPTGLHPMGHTGGKLIKVNSNEYTYLKHFVDRMEGNVDPCDPIDPDPECEDIVPGVRQLRRLTRFEYDNTIADLFGIPSSWGAFFTPENVVHGFDNNGLAVVVNSLFADQVRKAAEEIAVLAVENLNSFLPCAPTGDGTACAEAFISGFGLRVFRRPLTAEDVARYMAIFNMVASEDGFEEGIKWVLIAFLQSPHFLYRAELGVHGEDGRYTLNGYEIASELSYLLWGTMPDEELFEAASTGLLLTAEGRQAQAERLLVDPRAHLQMSRFSTQWLRVQQLPIVPKDMELYPELTPEIREAMAGELTRYINATVFGEGGTFIDLFYGNTTYLTDDLATFYGVTLPEGEKDDDGFGTVSLSDTPYGGLLTKGAINTRHAFSNGSSPIHRGLMVRERMFCQDLPPPPPGIVVEAPPVDPSLTTKERFTAHSEVEPCTACHNMIDPIGYGFEHFDGVGRYRETENGTPIDVTGEIFGSLALAGTFDGIEELAIKLAESEDVQACYTLQWFRYGYGLEESQSVDCLIDQLNDTFVSANTDVRELLLALALSPHITERVDAQPLDPLYDPGDLTPIGEEGGEEGGSEEGGTEEEGGEEEGGEEGGSIDLPEQSIEVELNMDSQWDSGYCATISVTNVGDGSVQWKFSMAIDGTINQLWNANYEPNGDEWIFSGLDWNGTIDSGQSAEFGFCAAL